MARLETIGRQMGAFTLPAGRHMKITASMEKSSLVRHRWGVAVFAAGESLRQPPIRLRITC